jgi:hypothetical protein
MTPKCRTRQRGRWHDSREGSPPSPPRPCLSSTGSGGWSRPSAAARAPTNNAAAPAWPSYAEATACPQDTTAPSTPVAQLSPLHGTPSLRPHTSLRPLTLAEWNPVWHEAENAANEASDKSSDVGGSKETKHNDALAVDDTAVATRDVNALTAKDATSTGSDSPPLLSSPTSPETFLVDTPAAPHHVLLDNGATSCITNANAALRTPTPSIGALPTDDDDPMATLNRAISAHLSELNHQ